MKIHKIINRIWNQDKVLYQSVTMNIAETNYIMFVVRDVSPQDLVS